MKVCCMKHFYLDQFSIQHQYLLCNLVPQSLLVKTRALPTIYVIIACVCVCDKKEEKGMNGGKSEMLTDFDVDCSL